MTRSEPHVLVITGFLKNPALDAFKTQVLKCGLVELGVTNEGVGGKEGRKLVEDRGSADL